MLPSIQKQIPNPSRFTKTINNDINEPQIKQDGSELKKYNESDQNLIKLNSN